MKTLQLKTGGKSTSSEKITDRVKSFEDACHVLGITGDIFNGSIHDLLDIDGKSIEAYIKLTIIARALNEGWKPDWSNTSEYKYFPWFEHKSGVGLSFFGYVLWNSHTSVGSRLCYKTSDLAKYAGQQFEENYRDYLTL